MFPRREELGNRECPLTTLCGRSTPGSLSLSFRLLNPSTDALKSGVEGSAFLAGGSQYKPGRQLATEGIFAIESVQILREFRIRCSEREV